MKTEAALNLVPKMSRPGIWQYCRLKANRIMYVRCHDSAILHVCKVLHGRRLLKIIHTATATSFLTCNSRNIAQFNQLCQSRGQSHTVILMHIDRLLVIFNLSLIACFIPVCVFILTGMT